MELQVIESQDLKLEGTCTDHPVPLPVRLVFVMGSIQTSPMVCLFWVTAEDGMAAFDQGPGSQPGKPLHCSITPSWNTLLKKRKAGISRAADAGLLAKDLMGSLNQHCTRPSLRYHSVLCDRQTKKRKEITKMVRVTGVSRRRNAQSCTFIPQSCTTGNPVYFFFLYFKNIN